MAQGSRSSNLVVTGALGRRLFCDLGGGPTSALGAGQMLMSLIGVVATHIRVDGQRLTAGETLAIAAHTLVETYAVLARLAQPHCL